MACACTRRERERRSVRGRRAIGAKRQGEAPRRVMAESVDASTDTATELAKRGWRATRLPTSGDWRKDLPVTVPKSTEDERLEVMRAVL